ncbi:hypothetical protein HOG21_03695 [bacterium]|nr:hypothetical protein [bacterium]
MACPIHDIKSYEGIYKIKKRNLSKPIAILIDNYKWLTENTDLNTEQIEFLKNYDKPFTILTNSDPLKLWINYTDEDNKEFINRDIYKEFAFRVANNNTQKKLIKQH